MKPVVILGDGWSALGAAAFLAASGVEVVWATGSGARITPPLACLEWGPGVGIFEELLSQLQINVGELKQGSWVREFRNKSFREPLWTKAPNGEARREVQSEVLWEPEQTFVGPFDVRFSQDLSEIEELIRKEVLGGKFPNLRRMEDLPVSSFQVENQQIQGITLGSGQKIECDRLIYADRWSLLLAIDGMPKPIPFLLKRNPMGVLQANFNHHPPMGEGILESFYASVHKESGEEGERHVWGYFSLDGKKSHWTLCLTPEQVEDNHEIAKKLRRLKATLDKVFSGHQLLPGGRDSFASTVVEEQVRFEEEAVYSTGRSPLEPISLPHLSGVSFLTDGYGPSWAFHQVGAILGIHPKGSDTQTEDVDLLHA